MLSVLPGKSYSWPEAVVSLSGGSKCSLLVTESGKLFSWGDEQQHSNLGLPEEHLEHAVDPTRLYTPQGVVFRQVSSGGTYSAAIDDKGCLYTWGTGVYFQLGVREPYLPVPTLVNGIPAKVSRVSCGRYHIAVITDRGLFTWGANPHGQLGHSRPGENISEPTAVDLSDQPSPVFDVSCGWSHTAIVFTNGAVRTCGKGMYGVLGHGDEQDVAVPMRVKSLDKVCVCQVACGGAFTVALSTEGQVWVCGLGDDGQLGLGQHHRAALSRFTLISSLAAHRILSISAGESHAAATDSRGQAWLWGNNSKQQISRDDSRWALYTPVCVSHPPLHVQRAECGAMHTLLYLGEKPLDFSATPSWQLSNALLTAQYGEQSKMLSEAFKFATSVAADAKAAQTECTSLRAHHNMLSVRNTQLTAECRTLQARVLMREQELSAQRTRAAMLDMQLTRLLIALPPCSPFNTDALQRTVTVLGRVAPIPPAQQQHGVYAQMRAMLRNAMWSLYYTVFPLSKRQLQRMRKRRMRNRILVLGYQRHHSAGLRDVLVPKRLKAAVAASSGWSLHRTTVSCAGLL
eukprot:TRINITY_DN3507_c0_g1_i1.p1 TRINITY_DN3507_c0_g1~~TRINITY_DN3507_c0_g1_i1.p1  ORF type:complete len:572 (+),score=65.34 TRINITY_DN3507_c0_g1_i1:47-1762(+)